MRVLQVVNDFFPDPGGVQRVVLELSKALIQRGVEVKVVSTTQRSEGNHGSVEGVPVLYAGNICRLGQALISPTLVYHLMRENADVIHTHLPYPWSADWAALTGKFRGRPVVLTYHNDIVGPGWKRAVTGTYRSSLLQVTLSLTDRIVVTTPDRLKLSPILQRFRDKVVHIPLGVDSRDLHPIAAPTSGSKTIGFLALLRDTHWHKGLNILLEAMRILHRRSQPVKLKVGGDGNLKPYYQALAEELGVLEDIEFTGFLPEESLVEFYNSLDAFVLPSIDQRFEGFGLVASEALACGRPVVTTTATGIAPIISENGCGLVVPPGDPDALADAIQNLLCDPTAGVEMGRRGREVAERFSWENVAGAYEGLYSEVISKRMMRHHEI